MRGRHHSNTQMSGRAFLMTIAMAAALSHGRTVWAQQSRASAHAERQAAKAAALRPYEAGRLERLLTRLAAVGIFDPPVGVYPFVGSVADDSGVAFGPAVRLPFDASTGLFNAQAAWSTRDYRMAGFDVVIPALAAGRLRLGAAASWLDAPRVAFYGTGQSSSRERTNFLFRPTTVTVSGTVGPSRGLSAGGAAEYLDIVVDGGRGGATSIEDRFTPQTTPGLGTNPAYVVGRAFTQFDWRESPGYTTSGGLYRIELSHYAERSGHDLGFRRLDAEFQQYIPLQRARWVIAVRGLVSMTDTSGANEVPFFLLPSLGGSSELRGFPYDRFRDRNRMVVTGEYRWTPSRFLDMALFYDAGKVTRRTRDLSFRDLTGSYGVAARFHASRSTALRLELARGREGVRTILDFGPAF